MPEYPALLRFERIIEDIVVISEEIMAARKSKDKFILWFGYLTSNFHAGREIEIAHKSGKIEADT